MMAEDEVMSDREESGSESESGKKRTRSKFSSERLEEPEVHTVEVSTSKEKEDVVRDYKRVRREGRDRQQQYKNNSRNYQPRDEFTELLLQHTSHRGNTEQQKDYEQDEQRRDNNHNHKQRNGHHTNKPNNRGRGGNTGRGPNHKAPHTRNNENRPPPITLRRFEKEFEGEGVEQLNESQMVKKVATFLMEPNEGLILAILSHLGVKDTLKFLKETAEMEEDGGVMTKGKEEVKRRRSPGGCFFNVVKEGATNDQKKAIFTDERGKVFRKSLKPAPKFKPPPNTKKAAAKKKVGENGSESGAPLSNSNDQTVPDTNTNEQTELSEQTEQTELSEQTEQTEQSDIQTDTGAPKQMEEEGQLEEEATVQNEEATAQQTEIAGADQAEQKT